MNDLIVRLVNGESVRSVISEAVNFDLKVPSTPHIDHAEKVNLKKAEQFFRDVVSAYLDKACYDYDIKTVKIYGPYAGRVECTETGPNGDTVPTDAFYVTIEDDDTCSLSTSSWDDIVKTHFLDNNNEPEAYREVKASIDNLTKAYLKDKSNHAIKESAAHPSVETWWENIIAEWMSGGEEYFGEEPKLYLCAVHERDNTFEFLSDVSGKTFPLDDFKELMKLNDIDPNEQVKCYASTPHSILVVLRDIYKTDFIKALD